MVKYEEELSECDSQARFLSTAEENLDFTKEKKS